MFGVIEIDNKKYVERPHIYTDRVNITANGQILQHRLTLPATGPFWLKALTREVLVSGVVAQRRFAFKLGNTDGGIWYVSAGVGGTNDRVVDTLIFGNAQFPFVFIPHIYYTPHSNILMEFEDLSNNAPYTIHLGFIGSLLLPV